MKKFLVLAALACAFACTAATEAQAIKLVTRQLQWAQSDVSVPGGKVFVNKSPLAVGATDTSQTFSPQGWALPNAAFSDSVVIGWIVLGIDTTVAYTPAATSFTINIDTGGAGANELNMGTTGAVTFTDMTTTDRIVKFPIYKNFALARGVAGTVDNFGPNMRLRIVPIGGVWTAATLSLMYWTDESN